MIYRAIQMATMACLFLGTSTVRGSSLRDRLLLNECTNNQSIRRRMVETLDQIKDKIITQIYSLSDVVHDYKKSQDTDLSMFRMTAVRLVDFVAQLDVVNKWHTNKEIEQKMKVDEGLAYDMCLKSKLYIYGRNSWVRYAACALSKISKKKGYG